SGDTWAYRLSTNTWTRMTPALSPSPRQGHNVVYDSTNKAVLLFGGFDSATAKYYNDLWVYQYATNTWTPVSTPASPSGRRAGAMTYDALRQRTVLYGGASSTLLHDAWTLQLQASSVATAPPLLTSLLPSSTSAGDPGFTLTVTGAYFTDSSVVQWMGAARPTTFVRSTRLQANIPASDIASARTAQISVNAGFGGSSNSLGFAVVS